MEEIKLSLFADGMIIYVENPKEPIKKTLDLICNYNKDAKYKVNIQKSIAFIYNNNEQLEYLGKMKYLGKSLTICTISI